MKLEEIATHSFLTDLLVPGSNVLDAGCRFFSIPRELAARGCRVIAMDPDPDIEDPKIDGVTFLREALVARGAPKTARYTSFGNGTWNFIGSSGGVPTDQVAKTYQVSCTNIAEISDRYGVSVWDAVKLDCEGSEYAVLLDWPGPIARQITVEFHEHHHHDHGGFEYYKRMLKHIGQWYDIVQHEARHQGGIPELNYWDSVFVLR